MKKIVLMFLSLAIAPIHSYAEDCKDIKNAKNRLVCYDQESTKKASKPLVPEPIKNGVVKGTITWQYNNVVGTKGDVGASITLINSKFDPDKLNPSDQGLFDVGLISIIHQGDNTNYYGTADGYGHYSVENVRPGSYIVVIKSAQTKVLRDTGIEDCKSGEASKFFKVGYFKYYKFLCTEIQVEPASNNSLSHDFGNTGF